MSWPEVRVIIGIVAIFSAITSIYSLQERVALLERKVRLLGQHLDLSDQAFLPLSDRVKQLADDPAKKIAAIKAYRQETSTGLKEAKDAIEHYINMQNH